MIKPLIYIRRKKETYQKAITNVLRATLNSNKQGLSRKQSRDAYIDSRKVKSAERFFWLFQSK